MASPQPPLVRLESPVVGLDAASLNDPQLVDGRLNQELVVTHHQHPAVEGVEALRNIPTRMCMKPTSLEIFFLLNDVHPIGHRNKIPFRKQRLSQSALLTPDKCVKGT